MGFLSCDDAGDDYDDVDGDLVLMSYPKSPLMRFNL